ncbi:MAG TPA: DUF2249 domain-containing protein [Burkholderiaceae bacterium]|nr:DUF2249 domain-containing protein [Burkholderiaceae bacterium]
MIVIDARAMPPPEPFEKVIAALRDLEEGDEVLLILNQEPIPLYRFLNANDYDYDARSGADGCWEIRIRER